MNNNCTSNNTLMNCRLALPDILGTIQVLAQNNEIDAETRNKMVSIIKGAIKTPHPNFAELHAMIQRLQFGTTMPEVLDRLRRLTTF